VPVASRPCWTTPGTARPLRRILRSHLNDPPAEDLALTLTAGLAHEELRSGRGLAYTLMDAHDCVVDPLPNLLFTRDAVCGWETGWRSPAWRCRRADARPPSPAGLAHTVLAVPIAQERATMHLDTVCTMVDVDAVVMYPNVADELAAIGLTAGEGARYRSPSRRRSSSRRPRPWASTTLRIIDTGLDPVTAEREQWDDGNNTLAIGPRLAVAYERNVETNARLEDAGIELIRISGSELGSGRGTAMHVLPDQP
jgi:arginine deiminase